MQTIRITVMSAYISVLILKVLFTVAVLLGHDTYPVLGEDPCPEYLFCRKSGWKVPKGHLVQHPIWSGTFAITKSIWSLLCLAWSWKPLISILLKFYHLSGQGWADLSPQDSFFLNACPEPSRLQFVPVVPCLGTLACFAVHLLIVSWAFCWNIFNRLLSFDRPCLNSWCLVY